MKTRVLIGGLWWGLVMLLPCPAQLKLQIDAAPLVPRDQALIAPAPAPVQRAIINQRVIINNGGMVFFSEDPLGGDDNIPDDFSDPALPHLIEFTDGTRLHGVLEAIPEANQQIVWRHVDVSAPLAFPLAEVSRLAFGNVAKQAVKVRSLVKLLGTDWLGADVLSVQGDQVQLKLGDGSPLTVDRARVEWIYFARSVAPECYDGPTSFAGFESSGGWTFREGALRASAPTQIWRRMDLLPDQVEYVFEINNGSEYSDFRLALHVTDPAQIRALGPGQIQITFQEKRLQLWSGLGGNAKIEVADLSKVLRAWPLNRKRAVQYRVLEDRTAGRLLVFIDGRKAADWMIGKSAEGENRGGFSYQPMEWNAADGLSISRIRVLPWDGRVPDGDAVAADESDKDQVSLADGTLVEGRLETLSADQIKLRTARGLLELPRSKIVLLRLHRPAKALDEDPPLAHLRLNPRGEIHAAAVQVRNGRVQVRTTFGNELTLAPASIEAIELAGMPGSLPSSEDQLVFKNGDRLRGVFQGVSDGGKVRWKTGSGDAPVEWKTTRLAGVVLSPRAVAAPQKSTVLARFRNGDLLAGRFVALDREQVIIDTVDAGQLTIPRRHLRTLYWSADGTPPVADGAMDREAWEQSVGAQRTYSAGGFSIGGGEARVSKSSGLWQYFDGAFTAARAAGGGANSPRNTASILSRSLEAMPSLVEFSFDVSSRSQPVAFSLQLFSDAGKPGYMFQLHAQGISLYDMAPRQAGRAGIQVQQMQFNGKVALAAKERRVRLLADRTVGKVTVIVDGVVVGSFGPKNGERNLGHTVTFTLGPQARFTFSNLWIAPWDGQVPGRSPSSQSIPSAVALLANGDEVRGTVEGATPEIVKFESELGMIELPTERLLMIDLGGEAAKPSGGVRLRLAGRGVLTVKSYRLENGEVTCESELAGPVKLPLTAIQEIVLAAVSTGQPVSREPAAKAP